MPKSEVPVGWLMKHLGMTGRAIDDDFSARFRLQKSAFLLKHLGVKPFSDLGFSLYIHGPYSPTLAQWYYDAKPGGEADLDPGILSKLDWFMDNSDGWIEVASAAIALKDSPGGINDRDLPGALRVSKPWVTDPMVEKVLRELRSQKIIE
ncbi:MAG: hypothetical protein JRN21_00015 [Nitrososphaerota archaeon]|nr:hypothetical protein [Nitrososphaerota archaeon]